MSQEHDHKKYTATFDPSQQAAQYDGQLRFWSFNVPYGGKFASTFVCVENFVRIPPHGSNFVKDFSHFRSGAGSRGNSAEAIAVRQKQAIALLSRQFIGNVGKAAESCYACILARSDDGCFPPGVKILMGDGKTEKKVEEVSAGESVWNPVLKQPTEILRVTEGPEKKDLVLVHAGPLQLKVSDEHPILTEKGMKQAMSLVVGDRIKDGAGEWHRIDAITFEPPPFGLTVINFVLQRKGGAADGLLIADGMVVGDIIVQRELSARAKGKGIR